MAFMNLLREYEGLTVIRQMRKVCTVIRQSDARRLHVWQPKASSVPIRHQLAAVRKVERVAQSIPQQSKTEIELAHRRLFFELNDGEQTACPVGHRSKNLECVWELTMMKRADLTKPEGVRNAS